MGKNGLSTMSVGVGVKEVNQSEFLRPTDGLIAAWAQFFDDGEDFPRLLSQTLTLASNRYNLSGSCIG